MTDRQTVTNLFLIPVSFDAEVETFVFGVEVWFKLDVVAYRQIDRWSDRQIDR
jgi:hypothetical protein